MGMAKGGFLGLLILLGMFQFPMGMAKGNKNEVHRNVPKTVSIPYGNGKSICGWNKSHQNGLVFQFPMGMAKAAGYVYAKSWTTRFNSLWEWQKATVMFEDKYY